MGIILLILSAVLLLADAYILFGVLAKCALWVKCLFMAPTVVYVGVIARALLFGDYRQIMFNLVVWLTLCVLLPTLIFTLVSLVGKGLGLLWPFVGPIANIIGAVLAGVWLAMSLYGVFFGWKRVVVQETEIVSPKLPEAFDGYRIVQLSDFHIGTYSSSPKSVARIVEKVNSLNPDLILFTGDLVNTSSEEVRPFLNDLSKLRATDGIYSVLGNHDYCLYKEYVAPDSPARELAAVVRAEKEMGWKVLRNESVRITRDGQSLTLLGVDNAGGARFTDTSDLPKALGGVPAADYKILLSHDPSHWRREVLPTTDIDLTLSGHTHAMQFKLFSWSPSEWTYREWGGLYDEAGRKLYVSTGIGQNVAFRFGAYPQIELLTLKR